jgi:hypothetical protein
MNEYKIVESVTEGGIFGLFKNKAYHYDLYVNGVLKDTYPARWIAEGYMNSLIEQDKIIEEYKKAPEYRIIKDGNGIYYPQFKFIYSNPASLHYRNFRNEIGVISFMTLKEAENYIERIKNKDVIEVVKEID